MAEGKIQTLDRELCRRLIERARSSPRLRTNHNFHTAMEENPHRFLNVMVRGTYVTPHRHLDPPKAESFLVLEGEIAFFTFDDTGRIANPLDLWEKEHLHLGDERAKKLFQDGKFKILVKPPATMLAMRRLVYDNDHQAKDLQDVLPPRWVPENGGWAPDQGTGFLHNGQPAGEVSWLRYQHIVRPEAWPTVTEADRKPQLIRDLSLIHI